MRHRAQEPWINARRTYIAAVAWAVIVGGLMAAAAALLGMDAGNITPIGLLGGFGAAGFVIWFSTRQSSALGRDG